MITELSHTHKTRLHLSLCIFNLNTSVTGQKEGVVGFSQRKQTAEINCKLPSQYRQSQDCVQQLKAPGDSFNTKL